ncbi:MAG: hypothetical protein HZA46_09155 [Planctomycetales bacterium]|nr:hypothetical protein [Planctomycetales bacterium]
MARCDYCGTTILFGGVFDGRWRFCNENCRTQGVLLAVADRVPEDVLQEHLREVHEAACPKCGGSGPVDVHTSHRVWSAAVMTSWNSLPEVCCRSCGTKAKLFSTLFCGALGWWGFPWGLLVTPVQITRNVVGLFTAPDPEHPSPQLEKIVRLDLATRLLQANQEPEELTDFIDDDA